MKFLFETITVEHGIMCYYRIFNTGTDSYYAQGINGEEDFKLKRINEDWIADTPGTSKQAQQIGEELERKQAYPNDYI